MAGITVIGVIFVDVKGFPFGKYNPRAKNLGRINLMHGGVCRNVAENIAGTGEEVTFVSLTESSAVGVEVIDRLKRSGINTQYVETVEDGLGMWLAVMDETGDIAGQISKMPDTGRLEDIIEKRGDEIFSRTESVIMELDLGESLSERVIELCAKHNVRLYTVVGNMSVIMRRPELIKSLSCFICNEAELGKLCKMDLQLYTPDKLLELLRYVVKERGYPATVVTMGAQGSVYYDPKTGNGGHCPAVEAETADTSGAGDAFLSGTVLGLEKGLPLSEAVKAGTKMAGYIISIEESSSPDMRGII